jgi:uncharacterized lipoprotein YmbA
MSSQRTPQSRAMAHAAGGGPDGPAPARVAAGPTRRHFLMGAGTLAAAGCAPLPPAPLRLVHLPAAAPADPVTPSPERPGGQRWQLMTPVALPGHLDREALLVLRGVAGLQALPAVRWAEPLRDAVPRVLRDDLARLLGEQAVWTAPLPPGLQPTHQLRVEVLALHAQADGQVQLSARWTLARTDGSALPQARRADLVSGPSNPEDAESLAMAHRRVLWQLARALASGSP